MANTYSQLYIQLVFATKNREAYIHDAWEEELYKYISGIIRNLKQKLLAINGTEDHIHIFVGIKPSCCISDLVREIKKASTRFINERNFCSYLFAWQEGYGTFSYGHSQLDSVCKYINNQKEHHKKNTFKEEYIAFLKSFNINYDDRFVFE